MFYQKINGSWENITQGNKEVQPRVRNYFITSNSTEGKVYSLANNGGPQVAWQNDFSGHQVSIDVEASKDEMYGVNSSGQISKFNTRGFQPGSINLQGTTSGSDPQKLIYNKPNDNVYVATSTTLERFGGSYQWFSTSISGVNDLAVFDNGNAVVAEDSSGPIRKFDTNGNELWSYNTSENKTAIATTGNGNVIYGNANGELKKLTTDGSSVATTYTGSFNSGVPVKLMSNPNGELYVAWDEAGNYNFGGFNLDLTFNFSLDISEVPKNISYYDSSVYVSTSSTIWNFSTANSSPTLGFVFDNTYSDGSVLGVYKAFVYV
ncbi:hypothetical protein [Salinibacter grassmerensis]|uniref:hypothetical protein n=1 Tax=Salinibacter grassmerensis TaxID=3040353 RepID=UPI0021E71CA8|nr:hypothetical protein [Salinibacter grassmerensis]